MTFDRILAIVAILLALPLGIIGTLLAPRVERWWATTSILRMAARLDTVKKRLEYKKTLQSDNLELARFIGTPAALGLMTLSLAISSGVACVGFLISWNLAVSGQLLITTSDILTRVAKLPSPASQFIPDLEAYPMIRVLFIMFILASLFTTYLFGKVFFRLNQYLSSSFEREEYELERRLSVDNK